MTPRRQVREEPLLGERRAISEYTTIFFHPPTLQLRLHWSMKEVFKLVTVRPLTRPCRPLSILFDYFVDPERPDLFADVGLDDFFFDLIENHFIPP
jgi:hypothetical protein